MRITMGQKIVCAVVFVMLVLSLVSCNVQQREQNQAFASAVLTQLQTVNAELAAAKTGEGNVKTIIHQTTGIDANMVAAIIAEVKQAKSESTGIIDAVNDNPKTSLYVGLSALAMAWLGTKKKK